MLSERDQAIVLDRERGDTYQAIAGRYGITHPRVMTVVKNATKLVNTVELDLLHVRQTGEQCAYLIPYGPNYTLAMAFSDWLIRRLRDRGLKLKVETRRAANGIALLIEDVTNYGGAR